MFFSSETSLPTPPGTSHRREKENRIPDFSSETPFTSSRVVWAEKDDIHLIECTMPTTSPAPASRLRKRPSKSILKKGRVDLLLPPPDEDQREVTPEPSDPLVDLQYLEGPVSRILAPNATLRDLIEAYSILAARIRSSVSQATDGDASWPLFQPLRKNRDEFVQSIERDLGRAMENPLQSFVNDACDVEMVHKEAVMLPSPRDSPQKEKKRKIGMTAEQAKYGRDLCSTSHAVLKLLGVILVEPAICGLFSDSQLGSILTAVLAIPLATELPTPNARKTHALAIWLIQVQRLSAEVLAPAAARIAYALRRGLDGELGKEGKKGSISDGLKAVHELSAAYPTVFVPVFADLLPSVFAHLIGPLPSMRVQACHALGGLAFGSAHLPSSLHTVHSTLAAYVATFLLTPPNLPPASTQDDDNPFAPPSPSKRGHPHDDPYIIRTLRATLKATDPRSPMGGPVWALCVIAHLLVLLRSTAFTDDKLVRCFQALFALALSHPKSSVRGLAALVWRCAIWAYLQPLLKPLNCSSMDSDEEKEESEEDIVREERQKADMLERFHYTCYVLSMGTGSALVAALVNILPVPGHLYDEPSTLRIAFKVLMNMAMEGGSICKDALETLSQMVCPTSAINREDWDIAKLISPTLFTPNPGLLTVEWTSLAPFVKRVLERTMTNEYARNLTNEEIGQEWVFDRCLKVWILALKAVRTYSAKTTLPGDIRDVWGDLIKRRQQYLEQHGDEVNQKKMARGIFLVLSAILTDDTFDLEPPPEDDSGDRLLPPISPSKMQEQQKPSSPTPSQLALKLTLVQDLWNVAADAISERMVPLVRASFLAWLTHSEKELVSSIYSVDESHQAWASLCATMCLACDPDHLDMFWNGRGGTKKQKLRTWYWSSVVRAMVWTQFVRRWQLTGESQWETGVRLLSVPFRSVCYWDMSNEHLKEWEECLELTINKALDSGIETVVVLDKICSQILADRTTTPSGIRVADIILTRLDLSETRQAPTQLFDFVDDVLQHSYPPASKDVAKAIWLLRTLTNVIAASDELAENILQSIADSVSVWITDEQEVFTAEYTPELVHLYQTVLLSAQMFSSSVESLETLAPLLRAGLTGEGEKLRETTSAFIEFWEAKYVDMDEPDDGWPEDIKACLQVIYPHADGTESETLETMEVEEQLACINSDAMSAKELSSEIEFPQPTYKVSSPSLSEKGTRDDPILVSTPLSSPYTPTPRTPRKSPVGESSSLLASVKSPTSSLTPMPISPKKSPRSQVRLSTSNKENRSPQPVVSSVMERILSSSPTSPSCAALSKKRPLSDDDDNELFVKRQRRVYTSRTAGVSLAPESRPPETNTSTQLPASQPSHHTQRNISSNQRTSDSGARTPAVKPKKRKSEFMEAVEVRTYRAVRRRTSSLPDASLPSGPSIQFPLRRTRSATRSSEEAPSEGQSRETSEKQMQALLESLGSDDESRCSSPLGALRPLTGDSFGSDDSLILATPSSHSELSDSSDDEPWIGQVTPHRLISPSVRRARDFDNDDPSSDDSTISLDSPISARQTRRSGGGAPVASATKAKLNVYNVHRPPLARLPLCDTT